MTDPASQPPILKLTNIYKSFGGVHALSGANLELRSGEIHALVGENGAGKTTLVKIITGVHQPDAGEIVFDGHPISLPDPVAAQQLGIAAIYQEASVFPDLNVAENILMGHLPVFAGTGTIAWRRMYELAAEPLRDLGVDLDPRARV